MTFTAIKPKGFKQPDKRAIAAELERWGAQVERGAKQYPAWMPWKNTPPKTGPRKGGRRTGNLGREWTHDIVESGDGPLGRCYNKMGKAPYAPFVQGKEKQARAMAKRGWRKIDDIADPITKETQKRMAKFGAVVVNG